MADEAVHVIDFGAWKSSDPKARQTVAEQIDLACRETGFIKLRNHGISPEIIQRLQDVTRRFFRLDLDTKRSTIYQPPHGNRGYAPLGGEALAATYGESEALPDLFEAFTIGPVGRPTDAYHQHEDAGRFFEPNLFPENPPEFKECWVAYYLACEELANDLMAAFAGALGLPEGYFAPLIDRHITAMRSLHYPALTAEPKPGQFRIGAHTDFGSLTILLSDGTPGLQVFRDGTWNDVVIGADELLVNIGDLMADWTNGRWTSTLHRVIASAPERDRLTVTYFHHPNYDAMIVPFQEAESEGSEEPSRVTAGEYLQRKLDELRVTARA